MKERSENNQFSIVPERSDEGNRMGDEEARRRSVTQKLIDSYDLCQAVISILFFSRCMTKSRSITPNSDAPNPEGEQEGPQIVSH